MNDANGQALPPGWCWASFDDIAKLLAGNPAPQGDEYFDDAGHPFVRVQDMGRLGSRMRLVDTKDHLTGKAAAALQLFPAGAVLFTKSGASTLLNQRAILHRPMYVVSHIAVAVPDDGILSEWLYYWLSTVDFANYAHATTLPSLPLSKVRPIAAQIAPSAEQARIADTLDELFSDLDSGVAALERVRDKLKLYRASVLKAAVEGALTADWHQRHPHTEPASELLQRIRAERRRRWEEDQLRKFEQKGTVPPKNWKAKYKEPVAPDTADLPLLPEGWYWTTWSQVGSSQNGRPFPSRDYCKAGTKLLRPGNLYASGAVGWTQRNTRHMPHRYAEEQSDLIVGGDELVINLTAQSLKDDFLGRVCLTSSDECCLLNQRLARLTPIVNSSRYMLWVFKSALFRRFVAGLNTGSLIQHMFTSQIDKFALPLPPMAEQEAIVEAVEDQLSVIEHLEADLDAKLENAQALRQSILRHAFTGQLVPQDPNDEPASKLLKRIAAEREARTQEAAAAKRAGGRKINGSGAGRRGRPRKRKDKDKVG